MYLLDTNVVSELRKAKAGRCHPAVLEWSVSVREAPLFLSVISIFEIEKGIRRVEQRDLVQSVRLRQWLSENVLPVFQQRILPVDQAVALAAATMHVPKSRSDTDSLIAATALINGLTVATRNAKDFRDTGVPMVNPWDYASQ